MEDRKINILHTFIDLHFGGISNLALNTLPGLAEKYNIYVVYFGPNEEMKDRFMEAGIKIKRIPYSGGRDLLKAVRGLKDFIKQKKIDVVSTNFMPDKLIVTLTKPFVNFRVIGTIHNSWDPAISEVNKGWRFYFEEFFHNHICDKVIGVSNSAIAMAKKHRNLKNRNTIVLHSAVKSLFPGNKKEKNKKIIFITACRFVEIKGLFRLIESFRKLNEETKNWELWLIGKGVLYDALTNRVAELGLEDKIQFKGYQKDLASFHAQADFYINSSYTEALGVSIIEAISTGLPAIGSRAGGIPEVIEDGKNGFLVNFEDENETQEVLTKAINLPSNDYKKMVEKSISTYQRKFSIDVYTEKLGREYEFLVDPHNLAPAVE